MPIDIFSKQRSDIHEVINNWDRKITAYNHKAPRYSRYAGWNTDNIPNNGYILNNPLEAAVEYGISLGTEIMWETRKLGENLGVDNIVLAGIQSMGIVLGSIVGVSFGLGIIGVRTTIGILDSAMSGIEKLSRNYSSRRDRNYN